MDLYVDTVCRVIEKYDQPVILIGHSRAGIIISSVAEKIPEKIDQLIYLCAFLIPDDEYMVTTALSDEQSLLISNLIFDEKEGWHIPKYEVYKEAFYNDCSDEDIYLCSTLLTKEPNLPVGTPLSLSDAKFGKIKKVYIQTTLDNTLSLDLQKKMIQKVPVDKIYQLQSDHSPFLSKPQELAKILVNL